MSRHLRIPLDPSVEVDESLLPPEDRNVPEARGEVVSLEGALGRGVVSGTDGEIRIIWAMPSPGLVSLPPTGTDLAEGAVTLIFSDCPHQPTLVAKWDSTEGLVIETIEGRPDLGEG
jgi:hypothetical protein